MQTKEQLFKHVVEYSCAHCTHFQKEGRRSCSLYSSCKADKPLAATPPSFQRRQ